MKDPKLETDQWVWSLSIKNTDKVVQYDAEGNLIERPIPKGLLDDAVKIFDGKPRAVRRTSGGLSLCEPHQIVIYDRTVLEPDTLWRTEKDMQAIVRIRVRFHELLRDSGGRVLGMDTVLQTKTTTWPELREPFTVQTSAKSHALADFGNGIVPLSIFHIETKAMAEPLAYFTEPGILEGLKAKAHGNLTLVTIYTVPLMTVRVPDGDSSIDLARAQENHLALLQKGQKVIPDVLKLHTKIPLPTGKPVEYLQSCLAAMLNPKERKEIEPLIIRITNEEDELLPFGLFEPG